ncbi:MAG: hypothetical protein HKL95_09230 [Phycisphaerae bacterium]|nr:hypothetical protein [Phycisphaerae bacterium]
MNGPEVMYKVNSDQVPAGAADALAGDRLQHWAGSFSYNALRQVRYVLAMVAAGLLFNWIGDHLLASPWQQGAWIAAWGPAGSLEAELVMLMALVVAVFMGMLITWPDTPHSGLLTTAVGLCILGLKWGPMTNLLLLQSPGALPRMYHVLQWQCVFWVVFVLAGEAISRMFYRLIFRNRLWIHLAGLDGLPLPEMQLEGLMMPLTASAIQADRVNRGGIAKSVLVNLGGLVITAAVASLVLMILLRSQFVGQVLFAGFVAFGTGAFAAGAVFPEVSPWAIWPGIPVTAAVLYFFSMHSVPRYPGQAGVLMAGALPIDYVGAGLAGAVLGYYTVLRMHLRRQHEMSIEERH